MNFTAPKITAEGLQNKVVSTLKHVRDDPLRVVP